MTVTVPWKYMKPDIVIELGALVMSTMKPSDCTHDLRTVEHYLAQYEIDASFYLRWLTNHGVNCDCEFVADIAVPLYEHIHYHKPEPWFLNDMFMPEKDVF
jgi:hypothetical protein